MPSAADPESLPDHAERMKRLLADPRLPDLYVSRSLSRVLLPALLNVLVNVGRVVAWLRCLQRARLHQGRHVHREAHRHPVHR